ncbi:hypothetical protein NQ315_014107 [Exocentrus adspersus]|uniref:LAGLIDADG homing endonuclease n=1 Tax=Exocentrus adspersus TaxID=1586481 RepID=A0AAV8VW02_9CUCU|nr:hypothetical protein NQ315_014107 [Exocentrus adspersus]
MPKFFPFLREKNRKPRDKISLFSGEKQKVWRKEMVEFDNWRKKRGLGEGAITEEVLLAYFFNVENHFAASSMWTKYSMLKSMLKVHKGIDISKYGKLTSYLKVGSRIYKTNKAKILERNQIEEFLKKAPDVEYLQVKGPPRRFYILSEGWYVLLQKFSILFSDILVTEDERRYAFLVCITLYWISGLDIRKQKSSKVLLVEISCVIGLILELVMIPRLPQLL